MSAQILMLQGTSSAVGKSILVAALCRILKQDGLRVAPFKAQNMALNSFVTAEGGEIGRAQAVQAEAAGIPPSVDMNPVLLKPETDSSCQVIVRGKVAMRLSAREYYRHSQDLLEVVKESLDRLRAGYDAIIIEGAGSPAEVNLKEREIVNMRVARLARSPVLLVGDIDRGGVFASLVGTLELLEQDERSFVKGLIINKFRGDIKLLQPGLDFLEKRTSRPVIGVVPYLKELRIAQEDSVYLDERPEPSGGDLDIAVIRLPHISNYDDFDPLEQECRVRYVQSDASLGRPHLVILPGTKSTMSDLEHLRRSGLAEAIAVRARSGTPVIGICGGFQMLGNKVLDPDGVEGGCGEVEGLGLLDVTTRFAPEKSTTQVRARVRAGEGLLRGMAGLDLSGYEIHMGQSQTGEESAFQVFATPAGEALRDDGAVSGLVLGTYIHGLFHNDGFRQALLANLREFSGLPPKEADSAETREQQYDRLADEVRKSLNMTAVYRIMREGL
ncbi:MAG: cobyric acid synthase [Chloroflexi bacterium]|nr:cobyric acid synthase [Chloroflexota bacterium]